jgi:hypothetical protein
VKNFDGLAAISEGNGKGEGGGGPGPFIGADGASFYCPNQWDLIRGKLHCGFYSGGRNGLGKKKMMRPDEWGLLVSETRGKIRDTVSVGLTGRGWLLIWAGFAPRGPFLNVFLLSSFYFSVFLICFITFAKLLQIKPNHFHKFCKNHSKVLNQ